MATSSGGRGDDPMDLSALFGDDEEEVGFFGLPDLPEGGSGSGGFPLPPEPADVPDPSDPVDASAGRSRAGREHAARDRDDERVDIAAPDVAVAGIDPTTGSVTAGLPLTEPVAAPRHRRPAAERPSTAPAAPAGRSMLRSNLVVAIGTALSRFTGMLRVLVFGIVIGQTAVADAYGGANDAPNVVYELLLGGVLSATLVPMFSRYAEDDDRESTEVVVSVGLIALCVLTFFAILAAPAIFHVFSLSPAEGVDVGLYRNVGTWLTRIFVIQIFFYGVSALFGALLNSRRSFFAPSWSPVLANLFICLTLLLVPSVTTGGRGPQLVDVAEHPGVLRILGLGATVGIALQALALLPALKRAGIDLRFRFDRRHPAVRQLLTMSGWTFGYVMANQVANVVSQNLADPGSGRLDAYNKASVFFYFPHGLLAVSIATTFVPEMARAVARKNKQEFIERTSLGVRLIALLTLPAGLGLIALSRPIIGALLEHGNFSATAATTTSRALAGFAIGLVGFSVYLFALRGLYAHHDTRSPFIVSCFQNGINIVLAVVFVRWWDVLGLGLAFGVSYLLCATWVLVILGYKVPGFPTREILRRIWPMLLSAIVMAEVVWLVSQHVGGDSGTGAVARVLVGAVLGAVVYLGLLIALRVPEVDQLRARLPAPLRSR
jgi:putative peptidoglycan lipid II flippase